MSFTQVIEVETDDPQAVAEHLAAWHAEQHSVAPGYIGFRLLADQKDPRQCAIIVDFSSAEEAQANDARPETQAWAGKLQELVSAARFRNCTTVAASS
jgi:quinol monooxygenase YgiN